MKPRNNKIILKTYYQFSGYLIACVALGVIIFYTFIKTSAIEITEIQEKTEKYNRAYLQEIDLTSRVDSILYYMSLLNSGPEINDQVLQQAISNQKMKLLDYMNTMDPKDCRIYMKIAGEINIFLNSKDSLRILSLEENRLREELLRCVEDHRNDISKQPAEKNNNQ